MAGSAASYHLETMKIRERIATCIHVRLQVMEPHREALRKTLALQALPFYAHRALKHLYATVDTMWYAAGDNSTDFNFYTKRLLLAGVYSSTLLIWLDDKTPGQETTWAFLDRRIADVMQIEKAKQHFKKWMGASAPKPYSVGTRRSARVPLTTISSKSYPGVGRVLIGWIKSH